MAAASSSRPSRKAPVKKAVNPSPKPAAKKAAAKPPQSDDAKELGAKTRRSAAKTAKALYKGIDHLQADDKQLVIDKLASSGLDLDDMLVLGMEGLAPKQVQAVDPQFRPVPGLKIPYFNPLKPDEPLTAWPKWPGFFRMRYLDNAKSFADMGDKKPPKYVQPSGTGVCAYFPRNVFFERGSTSISGWQAIIDDPSIPIIITEGELKSAKSCKEGFPTIGLGGVDSFKSTQLGISFLPELEMVKWARRFVYIIYDSDFRHNDNVCGAINRLAEQLAFRGAFPLMVGLPDVVDDGKTGLDDFLLNMPKQALYDLLHSAAQPLTIARALWKLNEQVLYVYNPGLVIDRVHGTKMSPAAFANHAFSHAVSAEQVINKKGDMSMTPVPAAGQWLGWPLRSEVGKLTYSPGKPQFIEGESIRHSQWNTWLGWGVEPVAKVTNKDIKPWLDLIDHIFKGCSPAAARDWFLDWCAYPLQYPGTKMFSSCLIYGILHGTGKSLIGYSLGKIYGVNFTEINQDDLHGSFNSWAENKQFVMGDDVTGSDKREDNDKLKKLITQEKLRINVKFVPEYEVSDCINYYFTSNQPDAFFLEDNDRRFFVHEVTCDPMEESWYVDYKLWLDTGGAEMIFRWLLDRDVSGFNPAGRALMTSAKQNMIQDTKSDVGTWVRKLKMSPDQVLRVGEISIDADLMTNRELLDIYDPAHITRVTANGLGRELRRAGFQFANAGLPIKTSAGSDRYYIMRNHDKWGRANHSDCVNHLEKRFTRAESKAKKY